jgi:hypothetical protein
MGTWSLDIVQTITYTSHGTTVTIPFTGVEITVGCTITSVPNPSPPTTGLSYTLYDPTLTIDVSGIPWTQSPPCDYTATEVITWTNPDSTFITVGGA